jgi:hypothetical protein
MAVIEDRLRETFEAQAALARGVDDPAGRAIRRARAIRRRRTLGSGTAAVACVVLALSGAVWAQARMPSANGGVAGPALLPSAVPTGVVNGAPAPEPEPTASVAAPKANLMSAAGGVRAIGLDLRVGRQLWTVADRRFTLTGVGPVTRVYRVPLGWVYGGAEQVRLLRPDGTSVPMGRFGTDWLVSADGGRLAYAQGQRLVVYRLSGHGPTAGVTIALPAGARPIAFAGKHVIIGSAGDAAYAAVAPGVAGPPAWNRDVVTVYGAVGDEVAGLVAEDDGPRRCLAALDAVRGFGIARSGLCRTGREADPKAVLAPDGRWLAEAGAECIVLLRFDRALADGRSTVPCPVVSEVPPTWVDAVTLATAEAGRVVLCRTDGTIRRVALPDGTARDWAFVPRLAAPAAPQTDAPAGPGPRS